MFTTPICLIRQVTEKNIFVVNEDLVYESTLVCSRISVLPGFRTNGVSSPRVFWSVVSPFSGLHLAPAILHDCLYETKVFDRNTCDNIFYEALISCGVSKTMAYAMFKSVAMFGENAWQAASQGVSEDSLAMFIDIKTL